MDGPGVPVARGPAAAGPPAGGRWTRRDLGIAVALLGLAVAVRLPYLQLVPRYTDEVRRMLWSVRIADGGFWPLAYKNGYNGPIMLYLTALALEVWPSIATPRAVALAVSSLTVPALYGCGRQLAGRVAGVVAALLLVTSFVPVVIFGHVIWAITFGALAAVGAWWAAVVAVQRSAPRWLVASAALAGVAVQCHPAAAFQLPGLALWVLAQPPAVRRPLLRAAPRAALAMVLAYSPILLFHLQQWARDGSSMLTTTRDLRAGGVLDLARYNAALRDLALGLIDALSGFGHHAGAPWTADPVAWMVVGVVGIGLAWTALAGPRLAPCLLASALLIQPLLIRDVNFPLTGRYIGLVVPAVYLAVGVAVAALWRGTTDDRADGPVRWRRRVVRTVSMAVVALVAGLGAWRIDAFYRQATADGRTNAPVLAMAAACRGGHAILDDEIDASFSASGNLSRVFEALLALQGTPIDKASTPDELDRLVAAGPAGACVVVSDAHRAAMRRGARLVPLPGLHAGPGADGDGYGVYRVDAGP